MRFLLLLTFIVATGAARAEKIIKSDHIQVRLLQSQEKFRDVLHLGVHYKLDPEWHIYWKNPGDSGAAPKFNVENGKINNVLWPYPARIPVKTFTNFGYEKEVAILLDVVPTDPAKELTLKLEWLVCKEECIPGFGEFKINLAKLESSEEQRSLYTKFLDRIPEKTSQWEIRTTGRTSDHLELEMTSSNGINSITELFIYPEDKELFLTAAPQIQIENTGAKIRIPLSPNAKIKTEKTPMTFVLRSGDFVEAFDSEIANDSESPSVLLGIIFAFLGGIILNLMPCVFPVLSLKIFGFIKETNPKKIRESGWSYTAGVLVTFLAVGGLLTALRYSGESVGWGFQLQSPWFTYTLAALFFVMALNFLGLFEMGEGVANFGGRFSNSKILSGSFGSGVLAVVVASPCTAPFMGSALGLTLLLPWYFSLLIFLSLGAGMASPLLLLSYVPKLASYLPRSGKWMDRVKKFMAIPLAATSLWLLSIHAPGLFPSDKSVWEPYNYSTLIGRQKTQPVFVDFTASWCITCQVNKKAVLDTKEIQGIFKQHNVFLMRADWTNEDEEITKALASFGRNSVPLYVFYDGGAKPKILPQLLTRDMIIELFEEEEGE
jgi:thiol:disulfide interchange protein